MAKESMNKVTLAGKIIEIQSRFGVSKKNQNYLAGTVSIETGEDNIIPVSFYVQEKTKENKDNPLYKSLETVVNEYKTVNSHSREEADIIEISGARLSENVFFSNDRMIRGFQVASAFFNRKNNATPMNEFIVTGEILDIVEEVVDDVPTGTVLIRLLVVGYGNRANVLDFVVEDPAGAKYVKATFSPGLEVKVKGNIVIEETLIEKKEEAAFGDPIITTTRNINRKLVVTSVTPPIDSSITEEERVTMLSTRESEIQSKKADAAKAGTQKPSTSNAAAPNFSL